MSNAIKTIYATNLSTMNLVGGSYDILPNTTLNEKFGVVKLANKVTSTPVLNSFTIGVSDPNTSIDCESNYSAISGALMDHVPLIIRELSKDLTDDERKMYRLRAVLNINNIEYVAYYGKKLLNLNSNGSIIEIEKHDDTDIRKVFNNNDPKILYPDNTNVETVGFIGFTKKIKIVMSVQELQELQKAIKIIYPEGSKLVTDIGLYSSIETTEDEIVFESFGSQMNYIVQELLPIDMLIETNQPLLKDVEIGGMELLR